MGEVRNATFGWISIALGMALGLALGAFSFGGPIPAPAFLEDYGGVPRRLLRLSHIAWIALGALNLIFAREASLLEGKAALRGGQLLLLGSVLLPPCLALEAFFPAARICIAPPALLLAAGAALIAWGKLEGRVERQRP